MLEVHLSVLLQPSVQVLQLVVQFDLGLHQRTDEDEYEPHLVLAADLLDFDAAEVLHAFAVHGALVDAVAETIDADVRGKQDDQVGCEFERFEDNLIESWLKISDGDVLIAGQMKLRELRLCEHHIHALPVQPQKPILIEFYVGIHLIHLSIIQQKAHLLLILLTDNHLLAGVHIRQLYGIAAHPSKRV